MGWPIKGVIKLMFRDEGFCEDHRSPVVRQCSERHVERLKTQGEECVRNGQGGVSKNATRRQRRCRVECVRDQASADDRRRLQVSCGNRLVHDSIPEDSDGKNRRHETEDYVNQSDYGDQVDHVGRSRLVEHCGSRDDSLSWNLSRVKQGETIRVTTCIHKFEDRKRSQARQRIVRRWWADI